MWRESGEQQQPLRTGLTTGCCATACSVAAAKLLLSNTHCQCISVTLPRGNTVEMSVAQSTLYNNTATVAIIKDAGDDPDVTHGATVFVNLQLIEEPVVTFCAAQGVGTVTKEGLALKVGEAAINPVPRKMITEHLQALAQKQGYTGGYRVAIGVENGDKLALKTMNPRLGIVGGLSILGTTGVVRPFSCSAYIASIRQGIDVCSANGIDHIAATTGSSSEQFISGYYQLGEMALIEMGDFVGVVLKQLKHVPIKKLSLCGGFGKISKLAAGNLDLHSRRSAIDFNHLAQMASSLGADEQLQQRICCANSSIEVLNICREQGVYLGDLVCKKACSVARAVIPLVDVEVWAVDRQGEQVGFSGAEV